MAPTSSLLTTTSNAARSAARRPTLVPAAQRPAVGEDRSRRSWVPWITAGFMSSSEQEARFLADLQAMAPGAGADHARSDVTACLNALRCGMTAAELLERTPGLRPARLVAAAADLEARRRRAADAWNSIVAAGSIDALVAHGEDAAALLPAVVGRLVTAAQHHPETFAGSVLRLAEHVDTCRRDAYRVEHALVRCAPDSERGRQLNRLLYQPFGESIAARDDYLADRIGMLTPTRVAALLGELDAEASIDVGD